MGIILGIQKRLEHFQKMLPGRIGRILLLFQIGGYSFQLKDDIFPGEHGAQGRWLFRVGFLDRDYADMMCGTLNGYKAAAESRPIRYLRFAQRLARD